MSTMTKTIEGEGEGEGVECPFVLMRTVPPLKYHEELHCLSQPGLTQQEYEQAVWARTLVTTFHTFP